MAEQVKTIQLAPTIVAPPVAAVPVVGVQKLNGTALEEQRLETGRNPTGNAELVAGILGQTIPSIQNAAMPAGSLPSNETALDRDVASRARQQFTLENSQFASAAASTIKNSIRGDTSIAAAADAVQKMAALRFERGTVSGIAPNQAETKVSEKPSINRPTDALGIADEAPKPGAGASAAVSSQSSLASAETPAKAARGVAVETAPAQVSGIAEPRRSPMAIFAANVLDAIPVVVAASFGRKTSAAEPAFADVPVPAPFAEVKTGIAANGTQAALGYIPAEAVMPMQTIDSNGEKVAANVNINAANENKARPSNNPRGDTISMGMGR